MTEQEWDRLSLKKKAETIIEAYDESRMQNQGGYPSQYQFLGRHVVWATVDHDDAPDLTVLPLREFVETHEAVITDYFEGLS
jgi:hypothetical protein